LMPRLPIGDWIDACIDWLKENVSWLFDLFSTVMDFLIGGLTDLLLLAPALVMVVVFALIAFVFRSWKLSLATLIGFAIVISMEQWETMMQTMALVLVATVFAVVIAVPLGILAAVSSTVSAIV